MFQMIITNYIMMSVIVHLSRSLIYFIFVTICLRNVNGRPSEGVTFDKITNQSLGVWYRVDVLQSAFRCCLACSQEPACRSVTFVRHSHECQLSDLSARVGNDYEVEDIDSDVYFRTGWDLLFRGTPETGTDPFIAYRDAVNVTTDNTDCQQILPTNCDLHYRNPIINNWDNLAVSQVKYAFYNGGKEAAYVIFDSTGRRYKGWFKSRLIVESSWPDMIEQTFGVFSMYGIIRRFVMNTDMHGTCEVSRSYTVTVTSKRTCAIDEHDSYPQFLYSLYDSASPMSDAAAFGVADCVAFYIR